MNVMSAVPVNGDQQISETTIMDNVDNSTPTWRARFVGQGYKQVKLTYCFILMSDPIAEAGE